MIRSHGILFVVILAVNASLLGIKTNEAGQKKIINHTQETKQKRKLSRLTVFSVLILEVITLSWWLEKCLKFGGETPLQNIRKESLQRKENVNRIAIEKEYENFYIKMINNKEGFFRNLRLEAVYREQITDFEANSKTNIYRAFQNNFIKIRLDKLTKDISSLEQKFKEKQKTAGNIEALLATYDYLTKKKQDIETEDLATKISGIKSKLDPIFEELKELKSSSLLEIRNLFTENNPYEDLKKYDYEQNINKNAPLANLFIKYTKIRVKDLKVHYESYQTREDEGRGIDEAKLIKAEQMLEEANNAMKIATILCEQSHTKLVLSKAIEEQKVLCLNYCLLFDLEELAERIFSANKINFQGYGRIFLDGDIILHESVLSKIKNIRLGNEPLRNLTEVEGKISIAESLFILSKDLIDEHTKLLSLFTELNINLSFVNRHLLEKANNG